MRLISSDSKRYVDIGTSDIWMSLYSTVEMRLGSFKKKIPLAIDFLKHGNCEPETALDTARQFNLMRDQLARISPDKAVYNMNEPGLAAPWANNLSPVITSCANLYTTADGKDLLFEIVSILTYGFYGKVTITADQG